MGGQRNLAQYQDKIVISVKKLLKINLFRCIMTEKETAGGIVAFGLPFPEGPC